MPNSYFEEDCPTEEKIGIGKEEATHNDDINMLTKKDPQKT